MKAVRQIYAGAKQQKLVYFIRSISTSWLQPKVGRPLDENLLLDLHLSPIKVVVYHRPSLARRARMRILDVRNEMFLIRQLAEKWEILNFWLKENLSFSQDIQNIPLQYLTSHFTLLTSHSCPADKKIPNLGNGFPLEMLSAVIQNQCSYSAMPLMWQLTH